MSGERAHGSGEDRAAVHGLARVVIDRPAGQLAAAMDEEGAWTVRVKRRAEEPWRLLCAGDTDSLSVTTDLPREPVGPIVAGPVEVRPAGRRVLVHGEEVTLARKEYDALLALAREPLRVLTKAELAKAVWGGEGEGRGRTLDAHLSRLRNHLATAGATGLVVNCRGVGYRLLPGERTSAPEEGRR